MLTDDENIVDLQFSVQYLLKDPEDYLFTNRHPDEAVKHAAETAMREIVGKSKMDYVLYEGRADIANRATQLMQGILDRYKTGIQISKLNMQNAQPPEQVQAAFDDAVKAGQDRERFKNEGSLTPTMSSRKRAVSLPACWKKRKATRNGWSRSPKVRRPASSRCWSNIPSHRK
jgi:HflK protein